MPTVQMDFDTMKQIAELSAQAAAQKVADSLRKDLREDLRQEFTQLEARLKEKLESQLRSHFGAMEPADHIVQHDRINRIIALGDSAAGGFVKGVLNRVGTWLATMVGFGLLYLAATGKLGVKL